MLAAEALVDHFKQEALDVMLDLEDVHLSNRTTFKKELLEEALFKACHQLAKVREKSYVEE